jgi:hypothetical protein
MFVTNINRRKKSSAWTNKLIKRGFLAKKLCLFFEYLGYCFYSGMLAKRRDRFQLLWLLFSFELLVTFSIKLPTD